MTEKPPVKTMRTNEEGAKAPATPAKTTTPPTNNGELNDARGNKNTPNVNPYNKRERSESGSSGPDPKVRESIYQENRN